MIERWSDIAGWPSALMPTLELGMMVACAELSKSPAAVLEKIAHEAGYALGETGDIVACRGTGKQRGKIAHAHANLARGLAALWIMRCRNESKPVGCREKKSRHQTQSRD
jgi:hypothetical protein